MLTPVLISALLVIATVVVHAVGFSALFRAVMRSHGLTMSGFMPLTRLMIGLTCGLMLIHLTEIGVWATGYFWLGCMPDATAALYFSAGAYTTLGGGDLVLPAQWRMLAPLETLTGMLMCGLSIGLFFALINQWMIHWLKMKAENSAQP